ncbi:MAG: DUF3108 domain-containing protein [Pseudomonadota bacterium]
MLKPRQIARYSAVALFCLIFSLFGLGAAVFAQPYESEFEFRIAGIKAGEMRLVGMDNGDAYKAEAFGRSAGLVGVFAQFSFDGAAEGKIAADGRVVPVVFEASSTSPRDDRETRIDWEAGTPVYVSVNPPRSSAPEPSAQTGTVDPVTASFVLLRDAPTDEICRKAVDIFDGSRRSRMILGTPQEDAGRLICNGSFERLEGEANSFSAEASYGFRVVFLEDPQEEGMARLDRIEAPTDFGRAALVRK